MIPFLVGSIALATVVLFGCVGEIITEKAGHLNLGIPGIMCVGTAGGCYAVSLYMGSLSSPDKASWILLILLSILFAAIFAAALTTEFLPLEILYLCPEVHRVFRLSRQYRLHQSGHCLFQQNGTAVTVR